MNSWEERSKKYGTRVEGVMPKSFPTFLNEHIHTWMYENIQLSIKDGTKILDIGSGYGRLSSEILANYPTANTFGIDISKNYVELYNKRLGGRAKATVSDMRKIPYEKNFFDTVICVTSLMYMLDKKSQEKALNEISRVLKPGGTFCFIERTSRGNSWLTLYGLIPLIRGKTNKEIEATSFDPVKFTKLLAKNNLKVERIGAMHLLTLFIHPIVLLSKVNPHISRFVLRLVTLVKTSKYNSLTPSLYVSYIGKKVNNV